MNTAIAPISKRELLAYQADIKGSIFRKIRQRFARLKENGFTQKDLAIRIGMNEGQLSRRLRGDFDLRLETLSDLARGLDCRIDVTLTPLAEVAALPPRRPVIASTVGRVGIYERDVGRYTGGSKSQKYDETRAVVKWPPVKYWDQDVVAPVIKRRLYAKDWKPVECSLEREGLIKYQFFHRSPKDRWQLPSHLHSAEKGLGGYRE
jgi:transcriptional regulator with XRE-family HTH domain